MRTGKWGSGGVENFVCLLGQSAALAVWMFCFGAVEGCSADSMPSFHLASAKASFFTTVVEKHLLKLKSTLTPGLAVTGEVASLGWGKIIFHLIQANLSLSALNCFILLYIQAVTSELCFKCTNAKCISYATSTGFEKKVPKTIFLTWQLAQTGSRLLWSRISESCCLERSKELIILLLSLAPFIAIWGEEIKEADRSQGFVIYFVVCWLNFLMSKLLLSSFVRTYFQISALYEQFSIIQVLFSCNCYRQYLHAR